MAEKTQSKIGGKPNEVKNTMKKVDDALFNYLKPKDNSMLAFEQMFAEHNARMANPGQSYTDPSIPARKYIGPGAYQKSVIPGQGMNVIPQPQPQPQPKPEYKSPGTSAGVADRAGLWKKAIEQHLKEQTPSGVAKEDVKGIQSRLVGEGFNIKVDGIWGPKTQAAYDAFRLKQMQASTAVPTEEDYMFGKVQQKPAGSMQSIPATSWRRPVGTLGLKNGGEIITNIIAEFKKGGKIKPENKGKFTATKKETGKSTEELTHSKNPVTKKRAVFAQNAAKWKKGGKK